MNKRINSLLSEIKVARKKRSEVCPLPADNQMPLRPMKDVANMIIEQRDFVERETLTLHLLEFYAFNTNDFTVIVSKELQDAIKFDEKYIDECLCDIADLIQRGKVYKTPNGIFTAWGVKKDKHTKGVLTVKEAIEECEGYKHGGI